MIMIEKFGAMLTVALALGIVMSILSRRLGGNIMESEGRARLAYRWEQVMMDSLIVSTVTMISILSFAYAEMGFAHGAGNNDMAIIAMSALFGSFFAAAAWSDIRTSITPDTLIGGTMASFFAMKAMLMIPGIGVTGTALAALAGIAIFAAMIVAFQNFEGWKATPSDAAFYFIIILTPNSFPAMLINIVAVVVVWIALKINPEIFLGMVSKRERDYLENVLAEVYGNDSKRRTEWLPLGSVALFTVTIIMTANLFISYNH